MQILQRLADALTLAAAAWIALWACAPPSSLPPPLPMASGPVDYGGALVPAVTAQPEWQTQPDGSLQLAYAPKPGIDAQAWVIAGKDASICQAGGTLFGGTTTAAGGGGMVRCDLAQNEKVYLGPQLEGGWLWAGVGVPASYLANPRLLLYTNPTFRVGSAQPFLIPLGVAWKTDGRTWITTEAGLRWDPLTALGYSDQEVVYLAVGATR